MDGGTEVCRRPRKPPRQKRRSHVEPAEPPPNASELPEGARVCRIGLATVGSAPGSYVTIWGTAVSASAAVNPDVSITPSLQLRRQLLADGFTAAPYSAQLMEAMRELCPEQLETMRRSRMPPGMHSSHVAAVSIMQLRSVLPSQSAVLGLYKARVRSCKPDHSGCLHKDDVLLSENEVRLALFPPCSEASPDEAGFFDRFVGFRADALQAHGSSFDLPNSEALERAARSGDIGGLTNDLIESIRRYNKVQSSASEELVFDSINVWIPMDSKQLALLPLELSEQFPYPLGAVNVEMLRRDFADRFQTFERGSALIFYGQSLLHQALLGPGAEPGSGSLEGRYLLLSARKHAQSGALRDRLDGGGGSATANDGLDAVDEVGGTDINVV